MQTGELKDFGDYELISSDSRTTAVRIVKDVTSRRVRGDCRFGNPNSRLISELNSLLSTTEYTPVIETYDPTQFVDELQRNDKLMNFLVRGNLDDLVEAGFTGDIMKVNDSLDYRSRGLKIIDAAIERTDVDGKRELYNGSRALVAKSVIDPTDSTLSNLAKALLGTDNFLAEIGTRVYQAISSESDEQRDQIYKRGNQLTSAERQTWTGQAGGWAMMAVAAHTGDQVQGAYDTVKARINDKWIHSSANSVVAAAILGYDSAERRAEVYDLAKNQLEVNSWSIQGRSVVAMGITADEGEARSEVYKLAEEKLKGRFSHTSDGHYMVALALTAQTPEERFKAFKLAEHYSDADKWSDRMNGASYISLGILAASDRKAAIKSIASLMMQDH